ncbi:4Fe-4S ferredoxin [Bacterioplanes sanyensis]|uniref:D-lactate dehydrogenase (cytochrome) n=1 Tax=Bacterioplanes sanyensis TaxID=1249553 RepID=A0A222FNK4_9GAMM|nr:FAD-binding and (Fe-S)-binding domain-containing protein [Bacterioplanes sanyensis]ASP39951.1 4Fe-4S ferredoxin [Bacterioplanes sanyensis]
MNMILQDQCFSAFVADLEQHIDPKRIISDPLRTLAYGTDASFYRLIPKAVIDVDNEQEVILILTLAQRHHVHITFRAAGTSLSGQAVTDGVLLRLSPKWDHYEVLNDGAQLTLQPGIIGAKANRILAPFARKIGPDPASINTAKIGGIVANNASGMCCGTAQNSYQTIASMRLVLADGTVLDTSNEQSRRDFCRSQPALIASIEAMRDAVMANDALRQRIQKKFSIKNTTGYSLNALIDFHDPIDIIQHLLVGSEGTLGFVSEVTYNTVTEHAHKASALLLFADIEQTSRAVTALSEAPVAAVELMDRAGLRCVEDNPAMPAYLKQLSDDAAALLVEVRANSEAELDAQLQQVHTALLPFETLQEKTFTTDPATCQLYWNIRKGLFPAVGAVRENGTTVIIEDVAFPVEKLAPAVLELQNLFNKYRYNEAIIFGHALAGNLHFVFTQNFTDPVEVQRYADFMDDVCLLVVGRYDGSLKAEHGTGRNMAPFVEMEWGKAAYDLMWQIKRAFDPNGVLNPDVILTHNARAHIENLKPIPEAAPLIDRCIECGFCEPVCPSRHLTLTPRQRIVVMRELQRQQREGKQDNFTQLLDDYQYMGVDTCAADGLCSQACPVGINTGDLSRQLRSQRNKKYQRSANWVADHFAVVAAGSRSALKLLDITQHTLGRSKLSALSKAVHTITAKKIPLWHDAMPSAARKLATVSAAAAISSSKAEVVYFPSCASRTMAPANEDSEQRSLVEVTLQLAKKAAIELQLLPQLEQYCCGMPLESKGHFAQADCMRARLNQALLAASDDGRIPVLIDTSPCVFRMQQQLDERIQLLDPIAFASQQLLPRLEVQRSPEPLAVHVTCSTTKLGQGQDLINLVKALSEQVVVPEDISCCGFAGDKGFVTPELNASALAPLKAQVQHCQQGVSTSRTCEIGLSHHSGIPYRGVFYLLDQRSRAKAVP